MSSKTVARQAYLNSRKRCCEKLGLGVSLDTHLLPLLR